MEQLVICDLDKLLCVVLAQLDVQFVPPCRPSACNVGNEDKLYRMQALCKSHAAVVVRDALHLVRVVDDQLAVNLHLVCAR